ncbi:MAG: alginate lyase family protein, partial [Saprospiraceae bacterium]
EREGQLKDKTLVDAKKWFTQFATWMTTHPYGIGERDNNNNHSTWWGAQVAAYGQFIGDEKLIDIAREQFKRQLAIQLAEDGSFPDELSRTRPYHYTLYNLDAWCMFALQVSSKSDNYGQYRSKNGSIRQAIDFLIPYIKGQKQWTLLTDLEFKFEPEVSDYSLYAYWLYDHQEYYDLWKNSKHEGNSLNADILVFDKLLHP